MGKQLFFAVVVAICVSLFCVGRVFGYLDAIPRLTVAGVPLALCGVAAFASIGYLTLRGRPFSFAYATAFYFFCIVTGYLWMLPGSQIPYNHAVAFVSAFASGTFFMLATLSISARLPAIGLPTGTATILPLGSLLIAAATVIVGTRYSFRLVSLSEIYSFRNELDFPGPLRYANGIVLSSLLPFAGAFFIETRRYALAGAALVLMASFYPITLTKFSMFAPFWFLFLLALAYVVRPRTAIVLSILLPILVGLASLPIDMAQQKSIYHIFGLINFRMFAIPSISLDVYNGFFATHHPTWFCQINVVRTIFGCDYDPQLGVEIAKAYPLGNFNASFLSTEGIASVGPLLAPATAVLCGVVIAIGSSTASHLPPRFVLLSSSIVVQQLINVPLSTALLSHGAALLFLLWYLMPASALAPVALPPPAIKKRPATLSEA
ncbi:hypothetical protein KUL72_07850 [Bradyrhizobium arachidis]|uniref:hypothetical protein n=1 Tax=Bradyrhizobium arachidis TaxID=858423 RepID=UPI002163B52B|nr:hypothetical protein [Bradyrhizobium arachidis]UVO38267.1 hypothetical protein KUL72_07850 [Bradyrhizobium arachidis]